MRVLFRSLGGGVRLAAALCALATGAAAAPPANQDGGAETARIAQQLRAAAVERGEALAVVARYGDVLTSPLTPSVGPVDADVVIVAFSDYLCPACKMSWPALDAELAKDKGVRLVFPPFPLIGPGSELAAQATFAAHLQGRFYPLHKALMQARGDIDQPRLIRMAGAQGLDVGRLSRDMNDPRLGPLKQRTSALARDLVILGTPGLLVGGVEVLGDVTEAQLDGLVALDRCLARASREARPATICMDPQGAGGQ